MRADDLQAYVRQLNHKDRDLRFWAASYLSQIGPPAVEALHGALDNADPEVRYWAARALGRIGDPRSVGRLQAHEEDEDERVRTAVAWSLKQLGVPPSEGV